MRIRLLIGGLILLTLVLGVQLFLQQGGLSDSARQLLMARASEALGGPVSVGRTRLSLFPPRIELQRLLLPPVPPLFEGGTVEQVQLRLSLGSLLTGGLRSLDIRLSQPDLQLNLAARTSRGGPSSPPVTPTIALSQLTALWGTHLLSVDRGRIQVRQGQQLVQVVGLALAASPDVTLRHLNLHLSTGQVQVNGQTVVDEATLTLVLTPDRVRIRKAEMKGPVGLLELTGEVRQDVPPARPRLLAGLTTQPPPAKLALPDGLLTGKLPWSQATSDTPPRLMLGIRTRFEGPASGAMILARKLGVEGPQLVGNVTADGRLYGPADAPRWDGEINGEELGLASMAQRLPTAQIQLRVERTRVELVHAKVSAGGGEVRASGHLALVGDADFELRINADQVALGWLLDDPTGYGWVAGEGRLHGLIRDDPVGNFRWSYHNQTPLPDHPDTYRQPIWKRFAAQFSEANGTLVVNGNGQVHEVTARSDTTAYQLLVTLDPDGALTGNLRGQSSEFAQVGRLLGLPFVHGTATVNAELSGTARALQADAQVRLTDGRLRDLRVDEATARLLLSPKRLVFVDGVVQGDGQVLVAGALDFLPLHPGQLPPPPAVSLAANVQGMPLGPLVAVFVPGEPLALNFPASGKIQLVTAPGKLAVWGRVVGDSGTLYGQQLVASRARLWLDRRGMTLSGIHFTTIAPDGNVAHLSGDGTLWWDGSRVILTASTDDLPLGAVDLLADVLPFVSGRYAGKAWLAGSISDPQLRLDGALSDFTFYQQAVGDAQVALALSGWQLRLHGTVFDQQGATRARAVYYTRLKDDVPYHLTARLLNGDLVPWIRSLLPELDQLTIKQLGDDYGLSASGRVTAWGSLRGGPSRLLARLDSLALATDPEPVRLTAASSEPALLRLADGRMTLTPLTLKGDGLDVSVSGELVPAQSFDLQLGGQVRADWIRRLRPEHGVLEGSSRFQVGITGPWDAAHVAGLVQPDGLMLAPPELEWLQARINVTGDVALSGPLDDPASETVRAVLSPVTISLLGGHQLVAPELSFTARAGRYTIVPADLSGEVGSLRVEGGWHYNESVDLKAVGALQLGALVDSIDGFSQGVGELQVSGELNGPWDDPHVAVGMALSDAQMVVDAVGQVLALDSASLLVQDNRVVLDELTGQIGGGSLVAQGRLDIVSGEVNGVATLGSYEARPIRGMTATMSGDLALFGSLPAPTLAGDIALTQALYDRHLLWGDLATEFSPDPLSSEVAGPLDELKLEVRLQGEGDLRVDNNLAQLELDLNLLVGGTVGVPGLVGRVDIKSGQVTFREHVFVVDRAGLDFVSPDRIEVYVDAAAHTTVEHSLPDSPSLNEPIEINLTLSGPSDQIETHLSSRPNLPQADLLSILAVGYTTEELSAGGLVGLSEATNLVTGALQNRLEQQVNRMTGLTRFQVDPSYTETATGSTTSTARVLVGRKLFDGRGEITYSTVVDATREPEIHFSYRLGPRVRLILEQDNQGRKGGEVRYRIRFR